MNQKGGVESEDLPENVVKNVGATEETPTLLDIEVTKPLHYILYTLLCIRGEKILSASPGL